MNLKNVNLKSVNLKTMQSYKQKLKDLKIWAQVKSPKPLQSALSYTLGWLSPELLGTGFRMVEISDFNIKGIIPHDSMNIDSTGEVHQGLVLNAAIELARTFINRHMPENFYKIVSSDCRIFKQLTWVEKLTLQMSSTESAFDEFFSNLQENKKTTMNFKIEIAIENFKKTDFVQLKLTCEATNLLA